MREIDPRDLSGGYADTCAEYPALVPLPPHPEPRTTRWTRLELDAIREYGRAVEQAAYEAAIKACREQIYGDAMRIEGVSNCIDAIRSLMKEQPK